MKITVLAMGKLRDAPWRELAEHYQRLAGRYAPLDVIELRDEKLGAKRLTGGSKREVLAKEAQRILEKVPSQANLIALDQRGKAHSSQALARWLDEKTRAGVNLSVVIGGPLGLGDDVLERARERLSLGTLTLPHQMARVVLLEQLYRAWTILRGETYHY